MDLVDLIYDAVVQFPRDEIFSLTQQMKRAAVSIPCNIAEGRGRKTAKDYAHFLYQARGSVHELDTQIEIAIRRRFLSQEAGRTLIVKTNEVGKLINSILPDT